MDKKPNQRSGKPAGQRSGGKGPYGKRPEGQTGGEKRPFRPAGDRPAGQGQGQRSFRPAGDRPSFNRGPRPGQGRPMPVRPPRPAVPAPQAPAEPPPMSMGARRVALNTLEEVLRKDSYASLSLDEQLKTANLSQLDKRLCASIVYRTLENLLRIDYVLDGFLTDAEGLPDLVRDILRLSVCQLLFHDKLPDSAVVDEAVKLTRIIGQEPLTGLVNGVLRNIARGRDELKWPDESEGARYLSVMYSVPLWLSQRLMDAYGMEMAKAICAYRTERHFMTLRPNLSRLSDADMEALLGKKVWEVEKGEAPHAYRVYKVSEAARDVDYLSGSFSIQGESSMLCAQAVGVKPGMQVLDCCAAPGGKTAYLAETMHGTGRVYAWDIHDHRVALIRAMMKRLRLENIRPAVRDAAVFKDDAESTMDAVLLDAPCSGLGVMDDKPDIKLRVTPESVTELTAIQEKLLNVCCRYVKRNGVLVYSTCSFLPEENAGQIEKFLSAHPEFELAPLPEDIPEKFRDKTGPFGLQLMPHRDGVEGFFIARMRRVR